MNKYINMIQKKINILVVGDVMVDLFSFCHSYKKSAEAGIPIFSIDKHELRLGGAANVWNNIKGLNAEAFLCGSIGSDKFGRFIKECIGLNGLLTINKKTTLKHRYYIKNKQIFRVDYDYICSHTKKTYDNILKALQSYDFDAIIISDYKKGFCDKYFINNLIEYAKSKNIYIGVDSKAEDIVRFTGVNLLKINEFEYNSFFKREFNVNHINYIRDTISKYNIDKIIITLGKNGMYLIDKHILIKPNINFIKNADVIGAGDCVIACFTVAYLNNLPLYDCMNFAQLCTEYCIQKIGTKSFNIEEFKKEDYE